jgi:hypothetical protein
MPWHNDTARFTRVLEDIMAAPMAFKPSVAMQSRDHLGTIRLGLCHGASLMRKYMRIEDRSMAIDGICQRLSVKLPIAWSACAAIPGFHVRLRLR